MVVLWKNKGNTPDEWGNFEEALVWYEKALAVNGNYKGALNNKGVVSEDLGESEGALLLEK